MDPYILPNGVLCNLLGIDDPDALADAEWDITTARMTALRSRRLPGSYNLAHLCAFHRVIFGDVYSWAGEVRTVDIAKYDVFCRWIYITAYAADVFDKLARTKQLRGLSREDFLPALAEAYADINAVHPFREGNGRAQRAFLQQLARDAGHPISWAGLDPAENEAASIAGFRGDLQPLIDLLDRHVAREH